MQTLKRSVGLFCFLAYGSLSWETPAWATVRLFENASSSAILSAIDQSKATLDIEIYEMEDPLIRAAIRRAILRKVRVRIIHEPASVGKSCRPMEPSGSKDNPLCLDLKRLRDQVLAAGGHFSTFEKSRLCPNASKPCFMHGKMVLVDRSRVFLSTGNLNSSSLCHIDSAADRCNKDYTLSDDEPSVVRAFQTQFDSDLAKVPPSAHAIQRLGPVTVSPYAESMIFGKIRSAKRELWIENQYLKYAKFNSAILEAAKRGVKVTITLSDPCAFGRPSNLEQDRFVDTMRIFEDAGIAIRVFPSAARVGGQPGYMHAKSILIDETHGWIGSINGSEGAFTNNREFGLFFSEKTALQSLRQWMRENHQHPAAVHWVDAAYCGLS